MNAKLKKEVIRFMGARANPWSIADLEGYIKEFEHQKGLDVWRYISESGKVEEFQIKPPLHTTTLSLLILEDFYVYRDSQNKPIRSDLYCIAWVDRCITAYKEDEDNGEDMDMKGDFQGCLLQLVIACTECQAHTEQNFTIRQVINAIKVLYGKEDIGNTIKELEEYINK